MSYIGAKKKECSVMELKKIVESEVCPDCGKGLVFYNPALFYCENCDVIYYNKEISEKASNPKRGYSKGYTKKPVVSNR